MDRNSLKKVLKDGMLGEMDSVVLYESASQKADGEVKAFFVQRAEEEKTHYNYLLALYRQIDGGEAPAPQDIIHEGHEVPSGTVVSPEFVRRIGKDQILFSAMSTAALLELRSIEFYRKKKEQASDKALREFFATMEEWEKEHYETVMKIQEEAEHHYWEINRFEPF
jgi:rubrerythrin